MVHVIQRCVEITYIIFNSYRKSGKKVKLLCNYMITAYIKKHACNLKWNWLTLENWNNFTRQKKFTKPDHKLLLKQDKLKIILIKDDWSSFR